MMDKLARNDQYFDDTINIIRLELSDNLLSDAKYIVEAAQIHAYRVCNNYLVQRNWLLGYRIAVEELKDNRKENYGRDTVNTLSTFLTKEYGSGFDRSNLYRYVKFYKLFPKIVDPSSRQSLLSWTHYRFLIQVEDEQARVWYEKEAIKENWSVSTLKRNIWSQYYYRILAGYSGAAEPPVRKTGATNPD